MTRDEVFRYLMRYCASMTHEDNCKDCVLKGKGVACSFSEMSDEELMNCYKMVQEGSRVDHPIHYQGKYECIEIMRAMFGDEAVKAFCRCNSFKYRFRADQKNKDEDIRKAEWYEDYLIKMLAEERMKQAKSECHQCGTKA